MKFESTKIIELGSCAFRQWRANHSHCRFLHGYRLIAKFWFGCQHLDDKNWVVDFGNLDGLKAELQKTFDHTLCVAADDPQIELFKQLQDVGACDLRIFPKGVGIERTTEFCFNTADAYVRNLTNSRCWVEKVEVWEHDKNSATVSYNLADILPSKADPKQHIKDNTPQLLQEVVETTAEPDTQQRDEPQSNAARVGAAPVSNGWSNPFKGTSWGA